MVISFRSSPLVGELGHVQCASAVQSEFAYIFKGATNPHLVVDCLSATLPRRVKEASCCCPNGVSAVDVHSRGCCTYQADLSKVLVATVAVQGNATPLKLNRR